MVLISSAGIVKRLRDHGKQTLAELAAFFQTETWPADLGSSGQYTSGHEERYLGVRVERLAIAGLIDISDAAGVAVPAEAAQSWQLVDPTQILLSVAKGWLAIQKSLGISLTELEARQSGNAMTVCPIFGLPAPLQKFGNPVEPDVFVVMPFSREMDQLYNDWMRPVILECGLTALRADDFFHSGVIMSDVWSAICKAKVVLADCTGRNPNVFYEIGIAHTVGVPTVLLAQTLEDVPFDIRHRRVIVYEAVPDGRQALQLALETSLRTELLTRGQARHREPVTGGSGKPPRRASG